MNLETHSQLHLQTAKAGLPQIVDADLLSNGFAPSQLLVGIGPLTLHIRNRTKAPAGVMVVRTDFDEFRSLAQAQPPARHPALTGKMLLNNQSFRELFRIQSLAPDLRLSVCSLTVLFTDLKGSTDM